MELIRGFLTDRNGATAIEYALIAALISLAVFGALGATGTSVGDMWNKNANRLISGIGG